MRVLFSLWFFVLIIDTTKMEGKTSQIIIQTREMTVKMGKSLKFRTKLIWCSVGVFFKVFVEVGGFFESRSVGNFFNA